MGTRSKGIKWFPAYFTEKDAGRVIDVSGGKLSSTIVGMVLTKQLVIRTLGDMPLDYTYQEAIHTKVSHLDLMNEETDG